MLDISFSELLLSFVVALIVLGPERLPRLARTLGRWSGQAKGYLRNLTTELDRESHLAELRKQVEDAQKLLQEESRAVQDSFGKLQDETRAIADSVDGVEPVDRSDARPDTATPPAKPHE